MRRTRGPFDVAVVGAGSAGCALASELVRRGARVALIEAGPDYGPRSARWPRDLRDVRRRSTRHDWGLRAVLARGVVEDEPRAKVIGGCSAHNEAAAVWPPSEDLDAWSIPGWSAAELRPFVDRVESATTASAGRGRAGPVPTRQWRRDELTAWQTAFYTAARASGFAELPDCSAPGPQTGVALFHANVDADTRVNASFAFLDPIRERPELTIFDRTEVRRLVLRDGAVESLACVRRERAVAIQADAVVSCAGTYGTPLLLHRSGVRHRRLGRGLQDHPGVALGYAPVRGRSGVLAEPGAYRAQVVVRATSRGTEGAWDLHIAPYQVDRDLAVIVFYMAPESRGRVDLSGRVPRIRFRFFEDRGRSDLDALERGVEIARQIMTRAAGVRAIDAPLNGRSLRAWIRRNITNYAHASGTCAIGVDDGVVDPRCRVRSVRNLYVADASIMPRIPRANTNLLAMLIGVRAAAFVGGGRE